MTTSDTPPGPYKDAADAWRADPRKAVKDYPDVAVEMEKASAVLAGARLYAVQRGLSRAQAVTLVGDLQERLKTNIEHGKTIPDVRVKKQEQERER